MKIVTHNGRGSRSIGLPLTIGFISYSAELTMRYFRELADHLQPDQIAGCSARELIMADGTRIVPIVGSVKDGARYDQVIMAREKGSSVWNRPDGLKLHYCTLAALQKSRLPQEYWFQVYDIGAELPGR